MIFKVEGIEKEKERKSKSKDNDQFLIIKSNYKSIHIICVSNKELRI